MQKTFRVMAALCLFLFLSACSKFELIKDKFDDDKPGKKNDFIQVTEERLIYEMGELWDLDYPFQVKKTYHADGKKLKQVTATYRFIASDIYRQDYETFNVRESANQLDYVSLTNDTVASIKLNSSGKPISATANRWMRSNELKMSFTFFYNSGRLSEIKFVDDGVTKTYAKVEYETSRKNVKSVSFDGGSEPEADKVTYTYDYTKKVKAQFVPNDDNDQNFWGFLKYLNIFEELQPENVVIGSYFKTHFYPGDMIRVYSDHGFDLDGKLTSFKMAETMATDGPASEGSGFNWKITWK